jgi:glutathione S-transferase
MSAKLYSLAMSHPSHAVHAMLEHKRIEHDVSDLLPGMHPVVLRAARFRGGTVPALVIDGRRIQGSLRISRALDELVPEPPLFPADPAGRREVEAAEGWGEAELQPLPRRIFRWGLTRDAALRRWLADEVSHLPAPGLAARAGGGQARLFARMSGASEERVRRDLSELPATMDRIDGLIAEGTIGGEQPNAADFQIGATVNALLGFTDLRGFVEGRPAADLARRLFDPWPFAVPAFVPGEWLATRA